jgi:hypothetical protein
VLERLWTWWTNRLSDRQIARWRRQEAMREARERAMCEPIARAAGMPYDPNMVGKVVVDGRTDKSHYS